MLTVRDLMTRHVVSVRTTTPLKEVARLLIDWRISGVPVIDDDGRVIGIVSEADFLIKEEGPDELPHRSLSRVRGEGRSRRIAKAKQAAVVAGEAMTSPAITIGPETPISRAAAMMTSHHVNRLPVVENGRPVGIVTRADLVRAYVRSDEDLTTTIRSEVIRRILWLDPAGFRVEVHDGIASVEGRVERRSTAEMIERAIAFVPGIVDVRATIPWSIDDRDVAPSELDPIFPFGPR